MASARRDSLKGCACGRPERDCQSSVRRRLERKVSLNEGLTTLERGLETVAEVGVYHPIRHAQLALAPHDDHRPRPHQWTARDDPCAGSSAALTFTHYAITPACTDDLPADLPPAHGNRRSNHGRGGHRQAWPHRADRSLRGAIAYPRLRDFPGAIRCVDPATSEGRGRSGDRRSLLRPDAAGLRWLAFQSSDPSTPCRAVCRPYACSL